MARTKNSSTIDAAADQLRALARATPDGELLGSEETLISRLGVSRATVRQVARLLEREGLLRVRRGINGGYFAGRPDVHTIEATVSAHLESFDTALEDVFAIASVLWVEVMRKAATRPTLAAKALAARVRDKVNALPEDAGYSDVLRIELETRNAIFGLVKSRYIELIFQINMAFAQRRLQANEGYREKTAAHRQFVHAWRSAKLMEFQAIAEGDPELGMMAARYIRHVWHRQMLQRISG